MHPAAIPPGVALAARADNAPFIVAFLYTVFIKPNRRAVAQAQLQAELDEFLRTLRAIEGPDTFRRSAREYLDDWARGELAFLRKYYPKGSNEAEFDLTPATELVSLTETDVAVRIAELTREKLEIEREIARLDAGGALRFDGTQVKERFFQVEDTARQLLSDFRQVEENFRGLDRRVRETIAVSDEQKGVLLDAGEKVQRTSSPPRPSTSSGTSMWRACAKTFSSRCRGRAKCRSSRSWSVSHYSKA